MHKLKTDVDYAKSLFEFIEKSPSCFHVIDNIKNKLVNENFIELREENLWNIEAGGKYFTIRGDSSIIAFYVPDYEFDNYQIIASHSDSPSFKIKENPEMISDSNYVELNVEKYGGMIYSPWFDRPLSVAGRIVVQNGNVYETKLVDVNRNLLMIPNVAIHMNRDINDGYKYNAQKDMIPILGEASSKNKFMEIIAETAGVNKENIICSDLFLYNTVPGTTWGAEDEFISATKLDDLECAYTSVNAFINSIDEKNNKKSVLVCSIFDNEEVGSGTKQGADSTMLADVLERINGCCNRTRQEYMTAVAKSFMLSADNAHAVHPHHQEKADLTNKPYMNHGIVIKFNANQKYTTDAVSASLFKEICTMAEIPFQTYVNRSDIAGGSTLGNISNAHVSLNTVDIGLAQLAMHSPYETAGIKDIGYLIKAMTAFYNTHIEKLPNGAYCLRR